MKLVIIESPFRGDSKVTSQFNIQYARLCVYDSLMRAEAPFASHLLYTQEGVLRDTHSHERQWGMQAGFAWGRVAELVAVYADLGISDGMKAGIEVHEKRGTPVQMRTLPPDIWLRAPWVLKAYADKLTGKIRPLSEA